MDAIISSWTDSGNIESASASNPLIVLLHGYGSNEHDLPGLVSWLGVDYPWVSLRAPFALQQGGFAWFPITTPLKPSADDVRVATDAVWQWLDDRVDSSVPLLVIGFSQGGLMTTQLLRTRPERLIRTAVLAGFVAESAQAADAELAEARPDVFWSRGTADTVISDEAHERTRRVLGELTKLHEKVYPGLGHSVDERVLADLREYVNGASSH